MLFRSTSDIRYKINKLFKLFKAAVTTKCPNLWEVTTVIRKAKATYFSKMFEEVKN